MKKVYPVIIKPDVDGYLVEIPDMDAMTQGTDLVNAMEMARDCIGLKGITMEDFGKEIPDASTLEIIRQQAEPEDVVILIDIDFALYRESIDNRSVRKNLTIPAWLNKKAEKAGLNFSKVLQDALIERLDVKSIRD